MTKYDREIISNLNKIDFDKINLLEYNTFTSDDYIKKYNLHYKNYHHIVLTDKINDLIYKFNVIKNYVDIYPISNYDNLTKAEKDVILDSHDYNNGIPNQLIDKIEISSSTENISVFKFPNTDKIIKLFSTNSHHGFIKSEKINNQQKLFNKGYLDIVYNKQPKNNTILKTHTINDYTQALCVPIGNKKYMIFLISYKIKFYNKRTNQMINSQIISNDLLSDVVVSFSSEKSLILLSDDNYINLTNRYIKNLDEFYDNAKKMFYSKEFDDFDKLIKLQSYDIEQHVKNRNEKYKDDLINDIYKNTNFSKESLELAFKPTYSNNNIDYFLINEIEVVGLFNGCIKLLKNELNNDDIKIINAIIGYNDFIFYQNKMHIIVNPYNGDVYLNKAKINNKCNIKYEDSESMFIQTDFNHNIFIRKIDNYYIKISKSNENDSKMIDEIIKRYGLMNDLVNKGWYKWKNPTQKSI